MNVALTGVSGFIGSALARRLFADGHFITGLVRRTSRTEHVSPYVHKFVVGEQADEACWPELLDETDCVIHNSVEWDCIRLAGNPQQSGYPAAAAAFDRHLQTNLLGSIRLLRVSSPRQFIFISSISVHHDMRPRWGGLIDEDHPTRPSSIYGAYKAAVEAHVFAEHFASGRNACAIRPCGVYGVDPRLEASLGYEILKKVMARESVRVPGGGKWVHVEDVAAAVAGAVGNAEVAGKVFNLVDCYARWSDWARLAGEAIGMPVDAAELSPPQSVHEFSKVAARSLGVTLDRGHAGLRDTLGDLAASIRRRA